MKKLPYKDRLQGYEADKRKLREQNLSEWEYFRKIKELADKWEI